MQQPNCRCFLFSKAPCAFTHDGSPCGWPELLPGCPDCGKQGKDCTFFDEEFSENGCAGFTRVVLLCLRCQLDGGKTRHDGPIRSRIAQLSGGAACDATQLKAFKEALRFESKSLWLPDQLESPDVPFFWDRSRLPWRFLVESNEGAERVTMRALYGRLGIVAGEPAAAAGPDPEKSAFSEAQLAQLTGLVSAAVAAALGGKSGPKLPVAAEPVTVAAAQASQFVRGTVTGASEPPRTGQGQNPSTVFNLGPNYGNVGNSGDGTVIMGREAADLAAIARALREAGYPPDEIARALQSSGVPTHKPTAHAFEWLQATEGTSPLCVYTGLQGETRQGAAIRSVNIQTFDVHTSKKITMKLSVWPASSADVVALVKFNELGRAWQDALVQLNSRLVQITPTLDRGIVPVIPTNVDGFLARCYTCLTSGTYEPASVIRAWEASHFFVVDECMSKRSAPTWEDLWMGPVFQGQLIRAQRVEGVSGATGLSSGEAYCMSWNGGHGKCGRTPAETCTKIHLCVRCGGNHRVNACTRRE